MSSVPGVDRRRDLLMVDGVASLVIACDSVGGVGPRPGDTVHAEATTTASFATRVPLLEVLCAGAQPIVVVNTLSVARDGLGEQMIETVRAVAAQAGVSPHAVTGSTEDNVATTTTAIGVTVIGQLAPHAPPRRAHAGDVVLCAGLPLSAPEHELYPGHEAMVTIAEVQAALAADVHDAIPVGSKGVAHELAQLAQGSALTAVLRSQNQVDLSASAGPACCVLFSCAPQAEQAVRAAFAPQRPLTTIADLIAADSTPSR